jgi:hypothetical protein
MKRFSKKIVGIIVMVAVLLTFGAITAYAAVNDQNVTKIGNQYCVDTVIAETTVDGIVVQTVERKWIPENRYNPNDPRNPIPSVPTPPNSAEQTLRQAAIDSRNDLQTYGWSYQWSTTPVETYASSTLLKTSITFQVDASASADRWKCTFEQRVTFDANGNTVVEYYIGNQKYSVDSIKRMFAAYGKAR